MAFYLSSSDLPSLFSVCLMYRARDIEGKHEEFWNQGDFGYVKKEVDSMMTLCKPQTKVCVL